MNRTAKTKAPRSSAEIRLTWVALAFTVACSVLFLVQIAGFLRNGATLSGWGMLETLTFASIVGFLLYGNIGYQILRIGYFHRLRKHHRASQQELEAVFDAPPAQPLIFLVPSYKEEARIIRQTLLSAALQEYPHRNVVLLIDDPPHAKAEDDARALTTARALPRQLQALLDLPRGWVNLAHAQYRLRQASGLAAQPELERVAMLYERIAAWYEQQVEARPDADHTDRFFNQHILLAPATRHRQRAAELRHLAASTSSASKEASLARLEHEYRRLLGLFEVKLSSFERKRYVNLSHEANKAMNLNSYMGLIGKSYRVEHREDSAHLCCTTGVDAELKVPDAEFIITLDADSLLLPDYALRLAHIMQAPGNDRIAVVQTPYSAIPGPDGILEYTAGATTDIQYIIHQGFTRFNATYWVGANALLRKAALDAIAVVEEERGFPVTRYVQDRTVIEDTESTIDLVDRGWTLHNYPDRLAFSATPADFGALLIQRRRWANGGLIILPKLLRYLGRGPRPARLAEGFFRCHYLTSIAGVNFGLVALLFFPFSDQLETFWLPLTALPYYCLYARDMRLAGYRRAADILRVYTLNLVLLPVNLGGVFKSLHQAFTREKIPFKRTPKVAGRTSVPGPYVLAEYLIFAGCLVGTGIDLSLHHFMHAAFNTINLGLLAYGLKQFIGLRASVEDTSQWLAQAQPLRRLLPNAGLRAANRGKSAANAEEAAQDKRAA
jgi:cellulose synthase (UDP-forming)